MAIVSGTRGLLRPAFRDVAPMLRQFGRRSWLYAAAGVAGSALLLGIPTVLIGNPWYIRMTPVRTQDYAFWAVSVLLLGLVAGTYALDRPTGPDMPATATGGLLTFFAVGCPICNKLVVLVLGVSGALTFFAPLQLFIGFASVLLLVWTLALRAASLSTASCPLPATTAR